MFDYYKKIPNPKTTGICTVKKKAFNKKLYRHANYSQYFECEYAYFETKQKTKFCNVWK